MTLSSSTKQLLLLTLSTLAVGSSTPPSSPYQNAMWVPRVCKSLPSDVSWPQESAWSSFNDTVGGRLIAPLPPGIVCDVSNKATFDNTTCMAVALSWANSSFHRNDPVSMDWPNTQSDACVPLPVQAATNVTDFMTCDTSIYPPLVVNATDGCHVSEALKFAANNGVRLSVKATGHDFLGRSTSPGLSIWTRYILGDGVQVLDSFVPQNSSAAPSTAIKFAAGHNMKDIYTVAKANNLTVILGGDANVGPGGYLTGGGHSAISARYGLASDNVLEMDVVTPMGDIVTANEVLNPDLFWAMKGGGGATFGIMLSATIKTYPMVSLTIVTIAFNSTESDAATNNNAGWYSALTSYLTQVPSLSDQGFMGLLSTFPLSVLAAAASGNPAAAASSSTESEPMGFILTGIAIDTPEDAVKAAYAPFITALNQTKGITTPEIVIEPGATLFDIAGFTAGAVGYNSLVTSRLWGKAALSNRTSLEETYRLISKGYTQSLMAPGPGLRAVPAGVSSVTPAWREAYLHVSTTIAFAFNNYTAAELAQGYLTTVVGAALTAQAPDSGTYINEADPLTPNFQQAFWGSNYPRLLEIKRQYDPNGVLWCRQCVGIEDWVGCSNNGHQCSAKWGFVDQTSQV